MDHIVHIRELGEVAAVRDLFERSLASGGIDGELLQGWGLIFTELVNNTIEHGCRNLDDSVAVAWIVARDQVVLAVIQPGECHLTEKDFDDADPSGFAEEGRGAGLYLIRVFVDEVRIRPTPSGGTEIRITRKRDPEPPSGGSEL